MASINSNEKSPGDPPDKKLAVAEADAEKQPLSGVSINTRLDNFNTTWSIQNKNLLRKIKFINYKKYKLQRKHIDQYRILVWTLGN